MACGLGMAWVRSPNLRVPGGRRRWRTLIACQCDTPPVDAENAVRNAHSWFEVNSGWAPPDDDTLAEWIADGVCRCPDECLVAPEAWCSHGLASWALILAAL